LSLFLYDYYHTAVLINSTYYSPKGFAANSKRKSVKTQNWYKRWPGTSN